MLTVPGGELATARRDLGRRAAESSAARDPDAADAPGARRRPRARRAARDPVGVRGRDLRSLRLRHRRAALRSMNADRTRFALRDDPGARGPGADRFARRRARAVHAGVRTPCVRPSPASRRGRATGGRRFGSPIRSEWRRGASPKYAAIVELDGAPAAYALYRIKQSWQHGFSQSEVRLVETLASSPAAERELWRFVFGIDLIARVEGRVDPASPLFLMVVDPRSLQLRIVRGPLAAPRRRRVLRLTAGRSRRDDEVVLDVRDEFCPWNAGRWRVGREVERTDDDGRPRARRCRPRLRLPRRVLVQRAWPLQSACAS